MPLDDTEKFSEWVRQRWIEKDELLEQFLQTGRFPADDGEEPLVNGSTGKPLKGAGYIETEVKPAHPLEFLQIFAPVAAVLMVFNVFSKLWRFVFQQSFGFRKA